MSLSVCMIVKNEEEYLAKALQSVQAIADEVIVVDTGSTDKTVSIAEDHGAKVFPFTWVDDFSKARNFALSKASCDWVLSLDADEYIDEGGCQEILNAIKNASENLGGFTLEQRNYLSKPTAGAHKIQHPQYAYAISFRPVRLFRKGIQFTYRIHEQVDNDLLKKNFKIEDLSVTIHHVGSVREEQFMEKKIAHYKRLLKQQLEEFPKDPRTNYLIAKMYRDEKRYDLAQEFFEKTVQCDPQYKNPFREIAMLYVARKDFSGARDYLQKAVSLKPHDVSSWNNLAVVHMHLKEFEKAKVLLETQLAMHPGHPDLTKNLNTLKRIVP